MTGSQPHLATRLDCEVAMQKKLYITLLLGLLLVFSNCDMFFDEVAHAEINVESMIVKRGDTVRFDIGESGLIWSMNEPQFEWSILATPAGSSLDIDTAIHNKHGKNASFQTDVTGTYRVGLRVTVGKQTAQANKDIIVKEVPGIPSGLTVSAPTSSRLTVQWTADSWATEYEVLRFLNGQPADEGLSVYRGSPTSFTDTFLSSSTYYDYQVRAINEVGESAYSSKATGATLVGQGNVPGSPAGLHVIESTISSIELGWESIAGVTYNVYRATQENAPVYGQVQTGITGNTYVDSSLSSGTDYWYKISGTNSLGTGSSTSPISTSTLCESPEGVAVTPGTPTTSSLQVNWNSSFGATSYKVYRATSPSGVDSLVGQVSTTTYQDTGLASNTTYYYRIKAVKGTQESAFSSQANRKTDIETRITLVSDPVGTGTLIGAGVYAAESTQSISAEPLAGWEFIKWNDDNTNRTRNVVLAIGNNTYTATFKRVLFLEDFESATWNTYTNAYVDAWVATPASNGWNRTSYNTAYGSYSLSSNGDQQTYSSSMNSTIKRTINLSSFTEADLSFDYWANTEANYDYFTVTLEGVNSGTRATVISDLSGEIKQWLSSRTSLNSYCGESVVVSFEFYSDASSQPDAPSGIWIDNIKVLGK